MSDDPTPHHTQVHPMGDTVSCTELPISTSKKELKEDATMEKAVPFDSSRTALVNLIRDMVRTHPIVGLTELMKRIQLRGVILELFESCSCVRIGEVLDRMKKVSGIDVPKKYAYSMLKQYCVFRHNRYFLRLTVPE
ncbi:hypothetical protein FGIG_07750 [Fasciola gigantica]|uniref:Uncharacterized protein n=1 Tax=Fasciola gigantica TaxID=46835 RepID=A0A504Y992_FASGI|nr:hypothetical protein FGIG_07750 [Fasciola gigantica]